MNASNTTPGGFTALKQMAMFGLLTFSKLATALPSSRQAPIPDFTTSEAGNPFLDGWYADPDNEFYNGEYWLFPTYSDVYEAQTFMDAFSSPDLIHWTKHPKVLSFDNISWGHKALWAPAAIERNGKYYLYFGANDILIDEIEQGLVGGIGVAVADRPEGPYVDAIGEPLIGDFHNGAQPIDQDVFIDDDGQAYIYYGGHSHANVAKLNEDMISLGTFDDGTVFKEITPENYTEGSQMIKRNGVYYFMWSEGGWTGPDYSVSYAMADNPLGPFTRLANILKQDSAVARGSGHNGVINVPGTDIWYLTYHRRPLSETNGNHRVTCYERMYFEEDGTIRDIEMLVKDNFADGQMIAWKTSGDGEWTVENEKLKGSSGEGLSFAMLDTNFTDVAQEAVLSVSDFASSTAGLIFRASSLEPRGGDYYWARLHADGVEVGITTGGSETVLGQGSGTFEAGIDYHVKVVAVQGEIEVFVDDMDTAIVSATDSTLTVGANGVVVSGTATVDDVAVLRP
jgi:hypothetical protein